MKKNIHRCAALLLCSFALFSLLFSAACSGDKDGSSKTDSFGFNEAQRSSILDLAEAFIECGLSYNADNALSISEIEKFIYYLYNDEFTGSDAYSSIDASEALARIKMYFGIENILHTHKRGEGQPFYYSDGKYYVSHKDGVVESFTIVSAEKDEDDHQTVKIDAACKDGTRVVLEMCFRIEGDDTRILTCTRYDEK
ncbi:MAG: hypothetical protein IKI64_10285 [Clostridia bacterium]|nr:hypothetical protein [Clostridia bacterium]